MAKLGEAYIRVRADLEPFGKDLDRGLKAITDRFEKALNRQVGKAFGVNLGAGVREGLRESSKGITDELEKTLNVPANRQRGRRVGRQVGEGVGDGLNEPGAIKKGLANFISALEDGFSALPVEVKAVVGGAVLAAIIPGLAFLGAGIGAATIAGVAGVGIALASQFQEVEDDFTRFVDRLRDRGVAQARPFAGEVIASLDLFDDRLDELDPKLRSLFANGSRYVEPFARGVADAFEGVIVGLERGLADSEFAALSSTIEQGLGAIGVEIGEAFRIILSNPNLDLALSDLLETIEDLIQIGGRLINWSLDAWEFIRNVADVVGTAADNFVLLGDVIAAIFHSDAAGLPEWFEQIGTAWDKFAVGVGISSDGVVKRIKQIEVVSREWNNATGTTIKLTKEEEQALKDLNKQFENQVDLANDLISTQIDYQAAVDQTIDDLNRYGASLDLDDEKGRRNAKNIQDQINDYGEQLKARVEAGEITDAEAEKLHDKEILRIRAEIKERGGSLSQFDALFKRLLELNLLPPVPDKFGPFREAAGGIISALDKIIARQKTIANPPNSRVEGGRRVPGYANGGFITEPTVIQAGEGYREEVVLPLTNPKRSMELLGQSSLAGALSGTTNVSVFIGNEQLDSRMVRVSSGVNQQAARTLSMVPRMV